MYSFGSFDHYIYYFYRTNSELQIYPFTKQLCIQINLLIFYQQVMGCNQSGQLNYCYEMPDSKASGFSPVYRNPKFAGELTSTPDPSIKTYRDTIIQSCLHKYPNHQLAGKIMVSNLTKGQNQQQKKIVQSLTYKKCFQQSDKLGKAILGMKLQCNQKMQGMKFIGIYAKNRLQWLITDLACTLYGITTIPLYDTLGIQNLSYCLKQTEMTTLFASAATLKILLDLKDHGSLKNVVLYDRVQDQMAKKANKLGFNVLDFNALVEEGNKYQKISYENIKINSQDIYTFSYTSGTTGPPKGAMLSHRNITAFLSALVNHDLKFLDSDVYLSFLPLPHVFQRVVIAAMLFSGAQVVFYSGDMLKLKDDCRIVRPTIFIGVPRIFNRIVQKVQEGFQQKTGIAKSLIESGVEKKMANIQNNGDLNSFIYDTLVFSKVKDAFGGRIRQMISGSAPLSVKSFAFMQMIMSCPMYQGYGQTQNTAAAFIRVLDDNVLGHVGGVVSSLQFKLADIPQMRYTSNDKDQQGRSTPRGELWLRGPSVFSGYYKLKDKTDQAITKDGWLKTGDVAMLLPDGNRLRIIDRKKNIFKLQQGQYVAPQKVQDIYLKSRYVQQVFLHGQSSHNYCVAIVKPHKQHFLQLARKNQIKGSYEQLCNNKTLRQLMMKQIFNEGKSKGLNTFEQAKNIYLQSSPFVEKNILTNTLKLQRFEAKIVYKKIIQNLYSQGELPVK